MCVQVYIHKSEKEKKGVIWSHVHVCKAELLLLLKPGKLCNLQARFGLVSSRLVWCGGYPFSSALNIAGVWSTCMLAMEVSEAQKGHGVPFLCH